MGFRVLSKEEGLGGKIAAFLMGAQNVTEICFMCASLVCLYVDRRWRRKRVFGGMRAEAPASAIYLHWYPGAMAAGGFQIAFILSSIFPRPVPVRACLSYSNRRAKSGFFI